MSAPATRKADRAIAALLAVAAAAYLLPLRRYGVAISDDGWYLHPVLRMLDGEILYRDVWTFYAPLEHHLFAWWFALTGPSIVAARTLLAALLVAAVVLTYRLARRFAPPSLAWIPAALYGLVPGPWPKVFFGFCTAAFFVALARALERPGALRYAALGAIAGATFATRQDIGAAQIAIAICAAPLPALFPRGFAGGGARDARAAARTTAATLAGVVATVAPVAAYYAAHDALGDLVGAVFLRAAAQLDAFPPALPIVLGMTAGEGRGVAVLMLLPLLLYPALAIVLLLRLRRDGIARAQVLLGALLAYAVATLSQAYHPVLLVRFLQSAIPFYVLSTAGLAIVLAGERKPASRAAIVAAGVLGAAAEVWLVLWGVPKVHPGDLFTGSARVLRYDTRLEVLGDTLQVGWGQAEEVRLVRAFFAEHTQPGEPMLALPTHPLYWLLLDRPNPTRFLGDHAHGNFVMSAAQKQAEADRLLASPARFVVAEQQWYAQPRPADPLRQMLWDHFRPVRSYVSVVILERDDAPDAARLGAILRRTVLDAPAAADLPVLRVMTRAQPDAPLPWKLLGALAPRVGSVEEGIDAWHRAAALDPADVASFERAATLLASQQRQAEAAADLQRARTLRDSPLIRELSQQLGPTANPPNP